MSQRLWADRGDGETGGEERGKGEVEAGHSCLPRSRHWNRASADKNLGAFVLLYRLYTLAPSVSLSPTCVHT